MRTTAAHLLLVALLVPIAAASACVNAVDDGGDAFDAVDGAPDSDDTGDAETDADVDGEDVDAITDEDALGDADAEPSDDDADDGDVEDGPIVEDDEPGADTLQPEAVASTCHTYMTRHMQASMQHTDSVAALHTAIDKAFTNPDGIHPDTISWTEIETQAQIDRIKNHPGYATFWPYHQNNPVVNPRNAVPISWKKSEYTFISGSSHKASDGLAHVSPNRYVTRVRLLHKASGTYVTRVAHHAVSEADHPRDHAAYRLHAHAQDMKKFNEVMLGAGAPVIGSGDFNTVHLPAKMKADNDGTQKYAFDIPASGGSHGNHVLDWVVRRKSDGNRYHLDAVHFINLSPSDHKGVRARYTYRPAPCH